MAEVYAVLDFTYGFNCAKLLRFYVVLDDLSKLPSAVAEAESAAREAAGPGEPFCGLRQTTLYFSRDEFCLNNPDATLCREGEEVAGPGSESAGGEGGAVEEEAPVSR